MTKTWKGFCAGAAAIFAINAIVLDPVTAFELLEQYLCIILAGLCTGIAVAAND